MRRSSARVTQWPPISTESPWAAAAGCSFGLPRQQEEKDGDADQRRQHADRQLLRGDQRARQRVGEHQQRAAGQRRGGQQQTLVVAGDEPDQVRDDEADEADRPGGRDRGGGCQRGEQEMA